MDYKLFNAILAMDSYNRGYNPGIKFGTQTNGNSNSVGEQIGVATITTDSSSLLQAGLDESKGFYAVAYDIGGAGTIISYRGTDGLALDSLYGYGVSTGAPDVDQGILAFGFYQAVADGVDPQLAPISVTGHSLGGGLAGLVGSVYGKEGVLFDNMPFELSANNVAASALVNPSFGDLVYGAGNSPWAPTISSSPNSKLQAYHLDGEFLDWTRPLQQTPDTAYSLPGDPNLSVYVPDSLDLHSIAALIIHMFSVTEIDGATNWESASPHFWPILFDNDFATNIGMDVVQGRLSAAENLTSILAYSAIDEGVRVFGDTGIRAFYDDANDLGGAITDAGAGSAVETFATDISKSFVQFGGQLALAKIEKSGTADPVLKGVLTLNNSGSNQSLSVNFSDELWSKAESEYAALSGMAGRAALVDSILSATGFETEFRDLAGLVWGDDTTSAYDHVSFSLGTAPVRMAAAVSSVNANTATTDQVSLFAGGSIGETVYTSDGRDMVLAAGGNDTIYGSMGFDIVDGAAGADTLSYAPLNVSFDLRFENASSGGSFYDEVAVISYLDGLNPLANAQEFKTFAFGVENYVLGGSEDRVVVTGTMPSNVDIDGAGGFDTLDFSALSAGVSVDVYNGSVSGSLDFNNFEYFIGTSDDDVFIDGEGSQVYDGSGDLDEVVYANNASYIIVDMVKGEVQNGTLGQAGFETDILIGIEGITGSGGNDLYYGREGLINAYFNGVGNRYYFDVYGDSILGRDVADFSRYDYGIDVNFSSTGDAVVTDGDGGSLALENVEEIVGTDYVDTIDGSSGDDWLFGMGGNDFIDGNSGNDHLSGGYGNDWLNGGDGNDTYYFGWRGGGGVDTITDSSGSSDRLYFSSNIHQFDPGLFVRDEVNDILTIVNTAQINGLSSIEFVEYADGAKFNIEGLGLQYSQTISAGPAPASGEVWFGDGENHNEIADDSYIGTNLDDDISGLGGSDTLNGGGGNDDILGGEGNDNIFGNSGGDFLSGGNGNDNIFGGDDSDTIWGGRGR